MREHEHSSFWPRAIQSVGRGSARSENGREAWSQGGTPCLGKAATLWSEVYGLGGALSRAKNRAGSPGVAFCSPQYKPPMNSPA